MALVENHIVSHLHVLRRRVEDAVRHGTVRVADEDARAAAIIDLLELFEVLDKGSTTKCVQMPHRWRHARPRMASCPATPLWEPC